MRERDAEVSDGRLVRLLFLDMGEASLDGRGGVEGGVGTVALVFAGAGKGEVCDVGSRGKGVGVVDLTSLSMSMRIASFALRLRSSPVVSVGRSGV